VSIRTNRIRGALAFALCTASMAACADPNDYVLDLDFSAGEQELEAKMGAASSAPAGQPAAQAIALAWGRALGNQWLTELYGQFANQVNGAGGGGLDAVSWENIVRFAEPGEYAVDAGVTLEIERSRAASEGWKVTLGPLLQKDIDELQVNANILLTRQFGAQAAPPLQVSYQFQVKYRATPLLEPGVQALGGLRLAAPGGSALPRDHRAGPAVFGRYRLGQGRAIQYNAALLFGLAHGAPDTTLRAQVDYEF